MSRLVAIKLSCTLTLTAVLAGACTIPYPYGNYG